MLECEALHGVPAGVHQQLGGGPRAPEVPHQQDPSRGAPAAVALSQNIPLSIIYIASHRNFTVPRESLFLVESNLSWHCEISRSPVAICLLRSPVEVGVEADVLVRAAEVILPLSGGQGDQGGHQHGLASAIIGR